MSASLVGCKIWARGIVQGVGFRPFVYTQASKFHLTGWVCNTSSGVEIEVNGQPEDIQFFIDAFNTALPPLARLDYFHHQPCPVNGYSSFEILASQSNPTDFAPVPPDIAICPDCRKELFDPGNRRYRYPFINCTNCGPRFTIIQNIPYDRPLTTMAGFNLCPECDAEYHNPLDRRFHAQPNACLTCGPHLWFETGGEKIAERDEALQLARKFLKDGKILAIKGLGGFHLACSAANDQAVQTLRQRKGRFLKPFALMAYDLDSVSRYAEITPQAGSLLQSRQAPIVLLDRKMGFKLPAAVAPNQTRLGFMLAYTPLHLLLVEPDDRFPEILVMTSGNMSEEPICYTNEEALTRLAPLVDGFLFHNRPIHMRMDDSVVTQLNQQSYPIRRARGYAPDPLQLPFAVANTLAAGPELKNTFCLTRERYAFVSHHIGDLENIETLTSFEQAILHYQKLFNVQPSLLACDMHPDYLASRYARQRSMDENIPLVEVQHHHAHLAACLADNGWEGEQPVIGICFDGTGYGTDGAIWGGEILVGEYRGYQRRFHLKYAPLPGGETSIRKPSRTALAWLWKSELDWDPNLPAVQNLCYEERTALRLQLEKKINTPLTSSMGRLFDAVSAVLGICPAVSYEGQAAIELEVLADIYETGEFKIGISGDILDPQPLWEAVIRDLMAGVSPSIISGRFHNTIARMVLDACLAIRDETGIRTAALTGGVWQNRLLLNKAIQLLKSNSFDILVHRQVPANDGGVALGQAVVASKLMA